MKALICLALLFQMGLSGTVTVAGKILDRAAKPMVGARVLYTETTSHRTYSTKTDKKGGFTFVGVRPGYYDIVITSREGERIYTGKRSVRQISDDPRNQPLGEDNVLNIDLSTVIPGPTPAGASSNLAQGKEQQELARKQNAAAMQMDLLIPALHAALDARDWPRATRVLEQLIALDPGRWEYYQNLGTVESNLSHYPEAAQSFQKGVDLAEKALANPSDPLQARRDISGMMIAEADAYARMDKVDEAAALYRRAAALSPEPAVAYRQACNAQFNRGKVKAAIEACRQAVAADPGQWESYQLLAAAQDKAGAPAEELETYAAGIAAARKALAAHPDSPLIKNGLGQMLDAQGNLYSTLRRYDQAIAAFAESATLSAYAALPYLNLCATYENLQRWEDALAACDQAITSDPALAEAYYLKASALVAQAAPEKGKYAPPPELRTALQKYLELSPAGEHAQTARQLLDSLDSAPRPSPRKPAPK